jgi:hypothetical protein
MNDNKVSVYLAGAMEHDPNGNDWRVEVTTRLAKYNLDILNPYEFEPEQLKGLQPRRLPEQFIGRQGQIVKPTHWHQLKLAVRSSALYSRFKKYMRLIINYDMNIVKTRANYIICYWTVGTGKGGGTHAEINAAYELHKPVYIVQQAGADIPAWIEGCATRVYETFDELYKMLDEEFGDLSTVEGDGK